MLWTFSTPKQEERHEQGPEGSVSIFLNDIHLFYIIFSRRKLNKAGRKDAKVKKSKKRMDDKDLYAIRFVLAEKIFEKVNSLLFLNGL